MRGLLFAAAIVLLVAGCGAEVDTTKVTYPRTTVPAGQAPATDTDSTGTAQPRANDPAFTPEKLRTVDPCALLDKDVLGEVGRPAEENNRNGFAECANYMEDDDGKELNLTLTVGEQISNAVDANENIGGLPGIEDPLESGDACFVRVVTSTSPNFGISIQAGGGGEDLCAVGRTVLAAVVDRIRTDPPMYELVRGTLLEVDPCTLFEGDELQPTLGGSVESSPFNVHQCTWSGANATLDVALRLGFDPDKSSSSGSPVDLGGGITGYQEKTISSSASCTLEWKHRPYAGDDVEVVALTFNVREATDGADPCVPTQSIAKSLIPALPKV